MHHVLYTKENGKHETLSIGLPRQHQLDAKNSKFFSNLLLLALFFLLIAVLIRYILQKRVLEPIRLLTKTAAQFSTQTESLSAWPAILAPIANHLFIEITEAVLMKSSAESLEVLLKYRGAGIEAAIDDFGTGYSSLAYLQEYDIDDLKIDRAFIKNLASHSEPNALSEAIIVMAHKLGIKVVAERVETGEKKNLLTKMGCNFAQGWLSPPPVPLVSILANHEEE